MEKDTKSKYEFIPVIADRTRGKYENVQYLPFILSLFEKYKNVLTDDYYPEDRSTLVNYLMDEICQLYPWFLVCIKGVDPVGVVWISHWHGSESRYHSCQIHSYTDRKYWGKIAGEATDELFNLLFNKVGVERVQMEIPEFNHRALGFAKRVGFVREGVVRCATLRNGKPVNHVLFSKLKGEHHGKR